MNETTSNSPSKQPYHVPQVQCYGAVQDLTRSVAVDGNRDGAGENSVPNRTD
ncbi:hypothetical protein K4A83_06340 [Spirulina subsalsa FACHB-351]|uniref:Uncharacterized protein n=1 Tax=Spirulina subsalsa FACHB-351 TaxID=234711 RepID=A0ABT3L4I2_9CYAN|nr:hypothetical protein [Spirulina subsalsa]MCW6035890.1 hypothetical protein [Spirulina subsalsa FACHB-351]